MKNYITIKVDLVLAVAAGFLAWIANSENSHWFFSAISVLTVWGYIAITTFATVIAAIGLKKLYSGNVYTKDGTKVVPPALKPLTKQAICERFLTFGIIVFTTFTLCLNSYWFSAVVLFLSWAGNTNFMLNVRSNILDNQN